MYDFFLYYVDIVSVLLCSNAQTFILLFIGWSLQNKLALRVFVCGVIGTMIIRLHWTCSDKHTSIRLNLHTLVGCSPWIWCMCALETWLQKY